MEIYKLKFLHLKSPGKDMQFWNVQPVG